MMPLSIMGLVGRASARVLDLNWKCKVYRAVQLE
jgi:hypothetical protein